MNVLGTIFYCQNERTYFTLCPTPVKYQHSLEQFPSQAPPALGRNHVILHQGTYLILDTDSLLPDHLRHELLVTPITLTPSLLVHNFLHERCLTRLRDRKTDLES